jgi:PilZ domain
VNPVIDRSEKRRFQRVLLYAPLHAEIDSAKVVIVDISSIGARIEHRHSLPVGHEIDLNLTLGSEILPVRCTVVRCRIEKSVFGDAVAYHTGLRFVNPDDMAIAKLMNHLRELVNQDLEARQSYSSC